MNKAKIVVNASYVKGVAEKTVFSTFVEHMGRCVYGGIYDKKSAHADENGFRTDVLDAVRELDCPLIRYPGGNFVSGYDWKDGVGPVENRPTKLNLAWNQIEPNEVGVDEFMKFVEKAGAAPIMAVNLGTGTPQSAAELVEYCNCEGGTYFADERKKNGTEKPYYIKYWCLGNEMDGGWQIGAKTPDEYGRIATEAAKLMKWVDPSVKLTLCGSSGSTMPTFPEWDRKVLEHAYEHVDYISLHKYYDYPENNESRVADFLGSYLDFDGFISDMASVVKYVKCLKRSKHDVYLSFDEWNIWHTTRHGKGPEVRDVSVPRGEVEYDMIDAVVFSTLIETLVNHADTVKIACFAQLVNVLGPLMTKGDKVLKQTIFYPFMLASKRLVGKVYDVITECGNFDTVYGTASDICVCAVESKENELTVAVTSLKDSPIELDVQFENFPPLNPIEMITMADSDIHAKNTFDDPERVTLSTEKFTSEKGIILKPYSVNYITFKVQR